MCFRKGRHSLMLLGERSNSAVKFPDIFIVVYLGLRGAVYLQAFITSAISGAVCLCGCA